MFLTGFSSFQLMPLAVDIESMRRKNEKEKTIVS